MNKKAGINLKAFKYIYLNLYCIKMQYLNTQFKIQLKIHF